MGNSSTTATSQIDLWDSSRLESIEMKKIYIIDALNYLFRSYFAIRQMTNEEGVSTNALFGFIRSISKIQKDFPGNHFVCVFDGPNNKVSRLKIFPEYKGHRATMPEDLYPQIDMAKRYCDAAGIPHIEVDGVEADDAMGAVAKWAESKGAESFLCSSDKDLCQLVNDKIFVLQTYKDNLLIDSKGVVEKFGVRPNQIIDYLAIMGDSSDNIPGIKGFGAKAATELLLEFNTLENMLDHPEKQKTKKRSEKVIEERENALISKKLATIDTTVPIPKDPHYYQTKEINREELIEFYQKMNFNTLLKELGEEAAPKKEISLAPRSYRCIENEADLIKELKKISQAASVCIDVETTSTDPMEAKLIGIGFCAVKNDAFYVPTNGKLSLDTIVKHVAPFNAEKTRSFVGHNIKYDMHVLARYHMPLTNISFDTMIASYVLNAGQNKHNLDKLVLDCLSHQKISYEELVGSTTKKNQKTLDEVEINKVCEYCCEDVDFTLQLKEYFQAQLTARNLTKLFTEIEMPLLPILFKMEHAGIYIDLEKLQLLSKEFRYKIELLHQKITHLAKEEFNLNSPKQLGDILFDKLGIKQVGKKTKTGYSTSADILEELVKEHPIIELILEYRSLEKLRSTYVDSLGNQVNKETNRIHCSFNQSVTATGRLSSTNPNLQNIPIRSDDGKRIREAFRPEKSGWSYVSADYSQVELRILAHLCGDPSLIKAFQNGDDIHAATAAQVFGVKETDVTKEMRQQAKAVNFGLIYGQGAFGLSKELGISVKDANQFIEKYFKQYPSVKDFLESCKEKAKKEGKATTMFGRERLLPEFESNNHMVRAQAMRLAVNTPIQGSQADIMKLAMIEIDKHFFNTSYKSFCVLQIHDECIFECPIDEIPSFSKKIVDIMEKTVELAIPLRVDISIGKNWGEC